MDFVIQIANLEFLKNLETFMCSKNFEEKPKQKHALHAKYVFEQFTSISPKTESMICTGFCLPIL